jgi:hypothetical protein
MKQSDASQNGFQYLAGKNKRERGGFSYKVKNSARDLKGQIRELKALEDSPYFDRSESDIAGMILFKYVPKEIEKYTQTERKRRVAGREKTNEE